ncbi:MAG: hypothetical protein R2737_02910 [Candidatus Nanopelagicales bacterium]|uniref:hypothetical protein n=1 Tax=Gordonia sp. (in: high G+C Gram-positive bacteria) TaxID=84139 RepID=UPI0035283203
MTGRLARVVAVGLAVGGLVAGCGGSSEPTGSVPASPDRTASGDVAPDVTATQDVPASEAADLPGDASAEAVVLPAQPVAWDVDPCSLVTAAEVEAATGETVTGTAEQPPITCLYTLDGVDVFVSVEDGEGRMGGPAAVYEGYLGWLPTGEAVEVEGVGESALYAPSVRGLAVHVGDGRYLAVGVNGGFSVLAEPQQALVEVANAAVGRA